MNKKKNVRKNRDMSKKIDNCNGSNPMGSKKKYRFNILIIMLVVIFIVWLCLLVYRYNGYKDTDKKIDKIDMLETEIKLLNDNYSDFEDKVKKINELKYKNDELDKDVDEIIKDIEDLDYKVSKYSK